LFVTHLVTRYVLRKARLLAAVLALAVGAELTPSSDHIGLGLVLHVVIDPVALAVD
jgi:hypothetical protein